MIYLIFDLIMAIIFIAIITIIININITIVQVLLSQKQEIKWK